MSTFGGVDLGSIDLGSLGVPPGYQPGSTTTSTPPPPNTPTGYLPVDGAFFNNNQVFQDDSKNFYIQSNGDYQLLGNYETARRGRDNRLMFDDPNGGRRRPIRADGRLLVERDGNYYSGRRIGENATLFDLSYGNIDTAGNGPADPGTRTTNSTEFAQNYPGFQQGSVNYNPNNPSRTLADIVGREDARFEYFYEPMIDTVLDELNDTSIVDNARKNADAAFERSADRSLRQQSRYGVNMSPAQQAEFERRKKFEKALNKDATVNDARLDLKQRNDNLRRQLIDIGRGVADTATGGLSAAANNQAAREAQNAAADAQHDAARTATTTSLATTALMYILLGGSI